MTERNGRLKLRHDETDVFRTTKQMTFRSSDAFSSQLCRFLDDDMTHTSIM